MATSTLMPHSARPPIRVALVKDGEYFQHAVAKSIVASSDVTRVGVASIRA